MLVSKFVVTSWMEFGYHDLKCLYRTYCLNSFTSRQNIDTIFVSESKRLIIGLSMCLYLISWSGSECSRATLGSDVNAGTLTRFFGRWGETNLRGQEGIFRGVTLDKEKCVHGAIQCNLIPKGHFLANLTPPPSWQVGQPSTCLTRAGVTA